MQKTERKKRQGTGVKFIEAKYPALNADVMAVGVRVKLARDALGLSLEEVSEKMGSTGRNKYFLLRIEQGRADPQTGFLALVRGPGDFPTRPVWGSQNRAEH